MNRELCLKVALAIIAGTIVWSVGMRARAEAVPLHDGLISYWALDEGAGSIAGDTAPGGVFDDIGTLRNTPTWIDGMFGAGLQFNGTNEDVLIPNSADMDIGTSAVSLSAWVKLDVLPENLPGQYAGIFDSQPDNYVMYLDKANNELRFKVTTASGAAERPGVPASWLDTTSWHHVMGVYDGTGRARIYFDGELADSHAGAGLIGNVRAGQISGIASQPAASAGNPPSSLFSGGIADVGLWNRPLGLAEARYLFNNGTGSAIGAANPSIEPIVIPPPNNPSIVVSAHRGNSIAAPENTLAAFAASAGFADRVEFDVRPTQDGRLVIMHDATVDRTTDGSGSVSALNYDGYIDGLDAGSWFSPAFTGEPVPTMEQAVQKTIELGMTPLIERKAGSAAAYVDELSSLGILDDVVIISFDWNFLSQVRALDADVELGALGSGALNSNVIANVLSAGANFINWGDGSAFSEATVEMVHAAGLELHAWTVNSVTRMQELIDMGVDGITTDDPQALRELVPPAGLAGDFNGDKVVDAADYTVWRDGLGTTYTLEQYDIWKSNFGSTAEGGALANASVPEPASALMAMFAVLMIVIGDRRAAARYVVR